MRNKKQKPIRSQGPWIITSYSDIQNQGEDDEYDAGYIQFEHHETGAVICYEMDWLRSERSYKGEKPPLLLSVWNMFLKDTPVISGFVYRMTKDHIQVSWHVSRKVGCFKYVLIDTGKSPAVSLVERIFSDLSNRKIDMAAFLRTLDGIQKHEEDKKAPVIDLDDMRKKMKTS